MPYAYLIFWNDKSERKLCKERNVDNERTTKAITKRPQN